MRKGLRRKNSGRASWGHERLEGRVGEGGHTGRFVDRAESGDPLDGVAKGRDLAAAVAALGGNRLMLAALAARVHVFTPLYHLPPAATPPWRAQPPSHSTCPATASTPFHPLQPA